MSDAFEKLLNDVSMHINAPLVLQEVDQVDINEVAGEMAVFYAMKKTLEPDLIEVAVIRDLEQFEKHIHDVRNDRSTDHMWSLRHIRGHSGTMYLVKLRHRKRH